MVRVAAALFLSACALAAQSQPPRDRPPTPRSNGTGTISGRVTAAGTSDPIRKARVIAQAEVGRIPPVFTDTDGRFTITGLAAARYTLTCSKPGYARTPFTRTDAADTPARIDVADGADVADVEVTMPKAAAITGRVVDSWGEPVERVTVAAEVAGGRRPGVPGIVATLGETDDVGEYRLAGLRAGSYLVSVRAGPDSALMAEMASDMRNVMIMGDVRGQTAQYYPGGVSADRAQGITLAAGDEQSAIDFAVNRPQPQVMRIFNPPQRTGDGRVIKPTALVRGRVFDRSGRPLARARVRLVPSAGQVGPSVATTGDDGAYEFRDVAAGAYRVAASRTGYAGVELGQRHPFEPGQRLWVDQGATVDHIDLVLARHGTITGRILDENGDPIEGAAVLMLQTRYISGRRRLAVPANTSTARTNDLGRYRLYGVPAGAYLVSAEIGQVQTSDIPGYTRTYFPGTVNPADAQIVSVASGQQTGDVDFALQQTRTGTVAGRVLDSQGNPWNGAVVMSPSDRSGAAFSLSMGARVDPGGVFEFPNVAPGEYVIRAFRSRLNPSTEGEFASQFVTVTGGYYVAVEIHASAGATLTGRVVLEGAGVPNRGAVEIAAVPIDSDLSPLGTGAFARAEIRDDWTFELRGITGPRRFRLVSAPPGWGLRAVTMRGRDVTDSVISFDAGEDFSGIDVALTDRITRLTGTVPDNRGGTIADYAAIVFSTDRDRWYPESRFLKLVRASPDGAVDVQGMPPGEYFAAAIDRGPVSPDADDWQDPAFLESIASRASRVMLTEGLTASVSLRLIVR
jgi:protocatechuate 3,4-dioxygenase beta subunit